MISTTITINSISQFRRYTQILKAKRVLHLLTNTDSYPYTISFTTRSTKQTNNILKKYFILKPSSPMLLQHRGLKPDSRFIS